MKLIDIKVSRLIPGPADEVFAVWFDPACPGGPWSGAKKLIMDVAVDTAFYFASGTCNRPHFGRFVEIDRGRRVEHTWMCEGTRGLETSVTVTFEPRGESTQLTLVHRGVPDDEIGRQHEEGWNQCLARLETTVAQRR